jgi:hypothetical protein
VLRTNGMTDVTASRLRTPFVAAFLQQKVNENWNHYCSHSPKYPIGANVVAMASDGEASVSYFWISGYT